MIQQQTQELFRSSKYPFVMTDYGERLAIALKARGVDAGRIAKDIGVTYQAVKRMIDGKSREFSATNHFKVTRYLRISHEWLLFGTGDMDITTPTALDLSAQALDLALMLDDIRDEKKRRVAYAHCVLILSGNHSAPAPAAAPIATPRAAKQKQP